MESLLTETEVSEHLKVSLACLRRWRLRKIGPRFVKVGPLVRYRPEDLDTWVAALPAGGTEPKPVEKSPAIARIAVSA
jgi:hypothetical protein